MLFQQVLFLCAVRASFIHCKMFPPPVLLVYITSRDFSGRLVHAEVKGRRRKTTKKCVAHDGCFLLGNQLLFVIIFEECTVLLGRVSGGTVENTMGVRTGDGLLFKVMPVFVMTVDTHPVLWSCLSS